MFNDPEAFATTLLIAFIDEFGMEALEWAPETIISAIEDYFDVRVPRVNVDKLMAAILIVTTDSFYKSLPDFINLCNVLADNEYDPALWDPADAAECAWGITEAIYLWPPEEDEPFTPEIQEYIGKVLLDEGISMPPDVLKIARVDGKPLEFAGQALATDPVMYEAVYSNERDKASAIEEYVKDRMARLHQQLSGLILKNGTVTPFQKGRNGKEEENRHTAAGFRNPGD